MGLIQNGCRNWGYTVTRKGIWSLGPRSVETNTELSKEEQSPPPPLAKHHSPVGSWRSWWFWSPQQLRSCPHMSAHIAVQLHDDFQQHFTPQTLEKATNGCRTLFWFADSKYSNLHKLLAVVFTCSKRLCGQPLSTSLAGNRRPPSKHDR